MLARPSTQGSYQSKRSSRLSAGAKVALQPQKQNVRRNLNKEIEREAVYIGKRDVQPNRFNEDVEYRQPSKASSRVSHVSHPQDVEGQIDVDNKPFESQDNEEPVEDVAIDAEEQIDAILNRPESMRSQRTT